MLPVIKRKRIITIDILTEKLPSIALKYSDV